MRILVNLDMMLVRRKMNLLTLSDLVDVHPSNLSLLRSGKVKGIKITTLAAICKVLKCQITDILELCEDEEKQTDLQTNRETEN